MDISYEENLDEPPEQKKMRRNAIRSPHLCVKQTLDSLFDIQQVQKKKFMKKHQSRMAKCNHNFSKWH